MSVEGEIGELKATIRELRARMDRDVHRLDKAEQRLEWLERETQSHGERITGLWRDLIHRPSKVASDRPITTRDVVIGAGAVGATIAALKAVEWLTQMGKP